MIYVWNDNVPIAIHITEGEYSPDQLQSIANHEGLVVRDLRFLGSGAPPDYWPADPALFI